MAAAAQAVPSSRYPGVTPYDASDNEFAVVFELDPESVYSRCSCALYLVGVGRDDEATELLDGARAVTGHLSSWAMLVPLYRSFSRHRFDEAYAHAENLWTPGFMWGNLARASAFGQLGRHLERRGEVEALVKLQLEFRHDGREITGRLVRSQATLNVLFEGLVKAGI